MTLSHYVRLLGQDLHLLRRHGAWLTIGIFTVLLSLIVFAIFDSAMETLDTTYLEVATDPLWAIQAQTFPGAELSWRGVTASLLYIRSLPFCLPLILVVLTARVIANPIKTHTLREDLIRPIARHWLLAIRFSALSIASLASLLLCLLLGLLIGSYMGLDSMQQPYLDAGWESPGVMALLMGIGMVWMSDMVFIGLAMLLSLLIQPAGRVLMMLILFFVFEGILRGFLSFYSGMTNNSGGYWTSRFVEDA